MLHGNVEPPAVLPPIITCAKPSLQVNATECRARLERLRDAKRSPSAKRMAYAYKKGDEAMELYAQSAVVNGFAPNACTSSRQVDLRELASCPYHFRGSEALIEAMLLVDFRAPVSQTILDVAPMPSYVNQHSTMTYIHVHRARYPTCTVIPLCFSTCCISNLGDYVSSLRCVFHVTEHSHPLCEDATPALMNISPPMFVVLLAAAIRLKMMGMLPAALRLICELRLQVDYIDFGPGAFDEMEGLGADGGAGGGAGGEGKGEEVDEDLREAYKRTLGESWAAPTFEGYVACIKVPCLHCFSFNHTLY